MAIKTIIKAMERLTNRRLAVGMAAEHIKSKILDYGCFTKLPKENGK